MKLLFDQNLSFGFNFVVRQKMHLISNSLHEIRHFCFDANPYPTGRRGLRRNRNVWRGDSSELSHYKLEFTSYKLCDRLADCFPGSSQVRLAGLERADDRTIWEFAKTADFAIVTQDADFADMAALYGPPPQVVWLRCGNQTSAFIEKLFRDHADAFAAFAAEAHEACWELY
jgi:predicted nuclease of predicted toxin-antitoxin system